MKKAVEVTPTTWRTSTPQANSYRREPEEEPHRNRDILKQYYVYNISHLFYSISILFYLSIKSYPILLNEQFLPICKFYLETTPKDFDEILHIDMQETI